MRPRRKPLIVLLVKRAVFFLLIICFLTVFLYGIGTAQDFLDSTQLGLVRLASVLGLVLAVGSAYGFALDLSFAVKLRNPRFGWGAAAYLFSACFGAAVAFLANGILVMVSGNAS